jgi:hypothetical protein
MQAYACGSTNDGHQLGFYLSNNATYNEYSLLDFLDYNTMELKCVDSLNLDSKFPLPAPPTYNSIAAWTLGGWCGDIALILTAFLAAAMLILTLYGLFAPFSAAESPNERQLQLLHTRTRNATPTTQTVETKNPGHFLTVACCRRAAGSRLMHCRKHVPQISRPFLGIYNLLMLQLLDAPTACMALGITPVMATTTVTRFTALLHYAVKPPMLAAWLMIAVVSFS